MGHPVCDRPAPPPTHATETPPHGRVDRFWECLSKLPTTDEHARDASVQCWDAAVCVAPSPRETWPVAKATDIAGSLTRAMHDHCGGKQF